MRLATSYGLLRLGLRVAAAGLRHGPRRTSIAERVAALPQTELPIGAPVEIRWNEHLVPFITAQSDRDLAVALGLIHAHLRLAQMEILRRVAYGRIAEVLGPVAIPFDHALRLIDPARAVPAILDGLPEHTSDWLDGFVAGINHHLASDQPPPFEFGLLGIGAEPWTVADVLTVGRLAAADVNWVLWMRLLRLMRGEDWPEIWGRLVADGTAPTPSFAGQGSDMPEVFARLVLGLGRRGSNALAVSGRRSATGNAWLAGDPHLPLSLPSLWLQAAYHSPSYNVAGLMIPGIPVMAIGRNPYLAWGGTNLHAASSELFDVSDLPESEIVERRVRLRVRWSRPHDIVLRETAYGPIMSDAPLFGGGSGRKLALRWVGHHASDEISALLAINQARDGAEFRRAAAGFAIPGQTLIYADNTGRIGRVLAAWLPRRPRAAPADLASRIGDAVAWDSLVSAADFAGETDPSRGFVVSANDRPPNSEIPVGWFFSPGERAERMTVLLRASERIGLAELTALQADVAAPAVLALRDRICAAATVSSSDPAFEAMAAWDGRYDEDSAGALAFELALARLTEAITPERLRAVYAAVWHGRNLIAREIEALAPEQLAEALRAALAGAGPAFGRLRGWGAAHRLRLAHPLGAIPLLGRRWRFLDLPWPGSNETVFKSAHGLVSGRHAAGYGSNARYVFDLSDPDANRLVLLGGQDGHPGSPAFLDQARLFRRGEYLTLPLDPDTARARFAHSTLLQPV
ncbi:MAG TPA: penicillin acylase family protein [Stellaceae bacterium]